MPPKKQSAEAAPEAQTAVTAGVSSTSSFKDFNLKSEIEQAIAENGFERPSDIQAQAIPYCLERRDVRVQAKSGKGKTCVFVLSVLNLLEVTGATTPVRCLVLCNTRELAIQITDEFKRFGKHLPAIKTLTLIGKVPINQQVKQLKSQEHAIVVGTIGRVADLVRRKELLLNELQFLVIDEADQVLTAAENKEPLSDVLAATGRCQAIICSATFSAEAKTAAEKILREGFREVAVDDSQLILHGLVQNFMELTEPEKLTRVLELLHLKFTQAVVFCKSSDRAQALSDHLTSEGVENRSFIGRMPNSVREELYRAFKRKDVRVIVCTDVFQRGVDFEGVNLVIHFDMPNSTDAYLHRSGRAGRFETNGLVVAFVASDEDRAVLGQIQERFAIKVTEAKAVADIDTERAFLAK